MNGGAKPARGAGTIEMRWPLRLSLLVAITGAVYLAGTSWFASFRMEPLFFPLFRSLFHTSDPERLADYLATLRYTLHYLQYFVLLVLMLWVLGVRPLPALLLCVLLAAADEGHQYFVPDRTCSLRDLNFDMAGAATAFILAVAVRRLRGAPDLENRHRDAENGPAVLSQ